MFLECIVFTEESMRVLVVDDDREVLNVVSEMVEQLGHTVVKASDGSEAKEVILKEEAFDAILTDNNMPKMKGTELLRWFRTDFKSVCPTKLIISSAIESRSIKELCHQYSDIRSMVKPIDLDDLRLCL